MFTVAMTMVWFDSHVLPWVVFNALVIVLLVLDLKVFHRHAHEVKLREAIGWSAFWIGLAIFFAVPLYFTYEHYYQLPGVADTTDALLKGIGITPGREAVVDYLTGYLLEKALSVDNLFVFLLLFSYFKVEKQYQHRALAWGILGAIAMRAIFIAVGGALIHNFHWLLYLFGAFLVFTGAKMAIKSDEDVHPDQNPVLRLARKWFRVTPNYDGGHFFTRIDGVLYATPMFLVLLVVETTDVAFATDSIPAIFGITNDMFIVYSSNIFAILGLRALYFALAGVMKIFHLLHYGLAAILVFIGAKMLLETGKAYNWPHYDIPTSVALGVLAGILALSMALSVMFPEKKNTDANDAEHGG